MAIKIEEISTKTKKLKLLLYGHPGAGKTTLAATATRHPDMREVLFGSIDKGDTSAASLGKFRRVPINSLDDLEELLWALVNKDKHPELSSVQTLILDGVSELQTLELERLAGADPKRESVDHTEIQDYGTSGKKLNRIFRYFRDLDVHVIMCAWAKTILPKHDARKVNKEDLDPVRIFPNFSEKVGTTLMGYVDFAWYVHVNSEGQRFLITQNMNPYQAKTRGLNFARALNVAPPKDSPIILVKDPLDHESAGMDMADIYNLILTSEEVQTNEGNEK